MALDIDDALIVDLLARIKRRPKVTSFSDTELCGYIEDAMDALEIYGIDGYAIGTTITPEPSRKLRNIIAFQASILARNKTSDVGMGESLSVKTEESSYQHSRTASSGEGKDPETLQLENMINEYFVSSGESCITSAIPDFGVVLPSDSVLYGEGRLS